MSISRRSIRAAVAMVAALAVAATPAAAEDATVLAWLELTQSLGAQGYPVGGPNDPVSEATRYSARRAWERLGLQGEFDPRRLAAALAPVDRPEDFPCPSRAPAAGDSNRGEPVKIIFRGDLPEDYLADFYARAAKCYPDLLDPRPVNLSAGDLADESTPVASLPVRRTERSRASFMQTLRILGASLPDAPTQAAPQIPVVKAPGALVEKTLSSRRYSTDSEKRILETASPPGAGVLAALCRSMGYPASEGSRCAPPERIVAFANPDDGGAERYVAFIDHFELAVTIAPRESERARLIADALDNVRALNKSMQGPDASSLPIVIERAKAYKLDTPPMYQTKKTFCLKSADPQRKCDKISDATRQALGDRAKKTLRTIGWISTETENSILGAEAPLERLANFRVWVTDPGFESSPMESLAAEGASGALAGSCDPAVDAYGPWCHVDPWHQAKTLDANNNNIAFFDLAPPVGEKDDLGHGLHVGRLIAGGVIDDWRGLSGIGADKVRYLKPEKLHNEAHFRRPRSDQSESESSAEFNQRDFRVLFNHSYDFVNSECKQSSRYASRTAFETSKAISSNDEFDSNPSAAGGALSYLAPSNFFDVVAAPRKCENGAQYPHAQQCQPDYGDMMPLACLGATLRGIGAFPVNISGGSPVPMTDHFAIRAMDWLAAPGDRVLSLDFQLGADWGMRERRGSSQAAPIVTSLIARLVRRYPEASWTELRDLTFVSSTHVGEFQEVKQLFGMVNFYRAVLSNPDRATVWRAEPSCNTGGQLNQECISRMRLAGDKIFFSPRLESRLKNKHLLGLRVEKSKEADPAAHVVYFRERGVSTISSQKISADDSGCKTGGPELSPANACFGLYREGVGIEPINFASLTHIVAIGRDRWQVWQQ